MEELRSFLEGDVFSNPQRDTGRWTRSECEGLLGLKAIFVVTRNSVIAKMAEIILHSRRFAKDGIASCAFAASMPTGSVWPARSSVRAVSAGDSKHEGPGVIFITYSHAIAPLVRSGRVDMLVSQRAPPRGFDCKKMAESAIDPGNSDRDTYRQQSAFPDTPDTTPAEGTELAILLEPRGFDPESGEMGYFWEALVDAEPRTIAGGGEAYALTIRRGRGAGAHTTRSHVQSDTYFTQTLEAAVARAQRKANGKLSQGSRKGEEYEGRRYQLAQADSM